MEQQLQTIIKQVICTSKPTVLAMIVDIDGSAYRKEGAWMLFIEGNAPIGMISGGCLENDLQSRAKSIFRTGQAKVFSFDMSAEDDLGWGRGAGCNGVVHVLLRDIDKDFRIALISVYETLLKNKPVLYIQSMQDFSQYTFTNQQEDTYGFWDSDTAWEWIDAKPFQKIAGQRVFGNNEYFIHLVWPRPNLYIIGAGMDARPLAQFATDVGYGVHVLDWREEYCNESYFPKVLSVQHGNVLTLMKSIQFSPLDAVVIMTHDFQRDLQLVKILQNIRLLYCGILGSKKRTQRLLGGKIPSEIRTPVGLSIDAEGPNEIALSIVAELIAVRRGVAL